MTSTTYLYVTLTHNYQSFRRARSEFSTLVQDHDVKMGALCCAMRDSDPYHEYLSMVRISGRA